MSEKEVRTTRLIILNEDSFRFNGTSVSALGGQRRVDPNNDDRKIVGYAEVTKGFPFDRKDSLEEFKNYMEDHPAVHYTNWFEDRTGELA